MNESGREPVGDSGCGWGFCDGGFGWGCCCFWVLDSKCDEKKGRQSYMGASVCLGI